MKKINVITLISNEYINIFDKYFLSTLPVEIESLTVKYINKKGYFRHDPYSKNIEIIRTQFIIDQIKTFDNEILMMIDADVVFRRKDFSEIILKLLENNDIVFQNNESWYNFGVFALNCNNKTLMLFQNLLNTIGIEKYFCKTLNEETNDPHDQHIINDLVRFGDYKHDSLPLSFFGGHFGNAKIPNDWLLYHATNTYNMDEKEKILNIYYKMIS